jgi:hypothetical protein
VHMLMCTFNETGVIAYQNTILSSNISQHVAVNVVT